MKKLFAAFCLSIVIPVAFAQETESIEAQQAIHAMRLFKTACFNNAGNPQNIATWAESAVLLKMSDEQSKPFFPVSAGKAWGATNAIGNFVVSLSDAGLCTVYARKAKAALLKELYLAFLPKPETGMVVEKKVDETKPRPNGDMYTIGHMISRKDASFAITTVLSTSESDLAPMQAIISLSVGRK